MITHLFYQFFMYLCLFLKFIKYIILNVFLECFRLSDFMPLSHLSSFIHNDHMVSGQVQVIAIVYILLLFQLVSELQYSHHHHDLIAVTGVESAGVKTVFRDSCECAKNLFSLWFQVEPLLPPVITDDNECGTSLDAVTGHCDRMDADSANRIEEKVYWSS